ncbi:DUF3887 domain-containing protein [Salarchaeum sp. JOR-1]|uniref:DUF3887 domain-containing protein n=1 Tax=Salarchaeum sp. JOR-1 TaxID=2599399 RepID=UPI00143DDBD3|nr:DUF3887 domain-containing protein [Salarchaeum sp. JOR-1]
MRRPTRRDVLYAGAAGLLGLAGCQGDGETTTATTATTTTTASPTTAATTTDPDAQREAAVRFVTLLADGAFEDAHGMLSASVREQLSVAGLRSAWEQTTAVDGAFVGVAGVERTTSQGYDVLVVRAQFEAGVVAVQVTFDAADIVGLYFVPVAGEYTPPEYADESAFAEREVALDSPACSLGATITVPNGGADAGVVLVHGSGPHDRDETIGPNKPFKDLAWGLASRSVAVLRYEKRTYACGVAADDLDFEALVVADALTALSRLRAETDVSRTAVVGHSLGAYAAPRIAARDGDADAFLLAAPSRPLYELIPDQVAYLAELDGTVTDAEREQLTATRETANRLEAGDYAGGGFSWSADFWRAVADYAPVETASGLDADVYALQGGRDYQVSATADFPAWRDALPEERARLYDDLNHLFMAGEGPPNPGEYFAESHVAASVVADLAGWLGGKDGTRERLKSDV